MPRRDDIRKVLLIGSAGVTVRAKSAPAMLGSASTRSRASASGVAAGKMPPRIEPLSRR